jgi:hypothetical protein
MLGEESFKSIDADSPNFVKELDEFMRTLGIECAGSVPKTLLARQDLDETKKAMTAEIADEKEGEEHYRDLADKFDEMADDEAGHKKELESMGKANPQLVALVRALKAKGYLRMSILAELEGDYKGADIRAAIDEVFGKGAVEQTGKKLDEALKDAPDADTRLERKSLVDNIKNIQIKRQEATITARQGEMKGKSFKEVWGAVNKEVFTKDIRDMEKYYEYLCNLRDSGVMKSMFGARPNLMREFPELGIQKAGQVLAEWMRSVSKAEKKPFKELWKGLGRK